MTYGNHPWKAERIKYHARDSSGWDYEQEFDVLWDKEHPDCKDD